MILIVILLLIVYLIVYIKNSTSYWKKRNIAGPKPLPIFGNIKESVLRQKNITKIFQDIYNDYPDEKVVGIFTMMSPALLIRDLEIAKQILVKDFNCFSERGIVMSKKKLGDSIFHCDTETWRVLKGKLSPFFSSRKLKSSVNTLAECADKFVEHIEKLSRSKPEHELHQLFRKFTMTTIIHNFFSLNIDTYSGDSKYFLENLDKSIMGKSYISEMSMLYSNFMNMTNTSLFGNTIVKFSNDIVKKGYDQRKYDSGKKNIVNTLLDLKAKEESSKTVTDEEGFIMTDHLIASQVFFILGTGYESTGLSCSYALYHLSNNVDIQNRLIDQIDATMIKHEGLLTYDALNEMTYLEQVFNETLRVNSFTSSLQRVAMRNYTIPGTDIEIEKGITVIISSLAIHQDEKYHDNPLKFDPERFSKKNRSGRNYHAFFPFGLGPRSCFGFRYTKLLFKVAMVKILTKFIVRPSKKIRKEELDPYRTMLAMKEGIHVNILPRIK